MEGKFPGESFSEEEYGDIGTRKPHVLTAMIFLLFFSYGGLKNSEGFRKTGSLLSLHTNGYQNRLLAHLCWRTVRPEPQKLLALFNNCPEQPPPEAPLEQCLLNPGTCRGYCKSLPITFARLAASPEKKTHSDVGLAFLSSVVSSPRVAVLLLPPELSRAALIWAAAGSLAWRPNHQCASEGGSRVGGAGRTTWLEFPRCQPTRLPSSLRLLFLSLTSFPNIGLRSLHQRAVLGEGTC